MRTLKIEAKIKNLEKVISFLDSYLEEINCPMKDQIQLDVALEEMYVNIAHYAYGVEDTDNEAEILLDYDESSRCFSASLIDSGIYFNPLDKEDPDITLDISERQIGGLGIYMVKKSMDSVEYERKDNKNKFTFKKNFS